MPPRRGVHSSSAPAASILPVLMSLLPSCRCRARGAAAVAAPRAPGFRVLAVFPGGRATGGRSGLALSTTTRSARAERLVDVVGDEQHCGPWRSHRPQHEVVHRHSGQRVECTERLVEQQQRRARGRAPAPARPAGPRRPTRSTATRRGGRSGRPLPARRAPPRPRSGRRSPSRTLGSTRLHGTSRASWKATATVPRTSTSPSTRSSSPASARSNVDLPEPLRPSIATNSLAPISRSSESSTRRSPNVRVTPRSRATEVDAPVAAASPGSGPAVTKPTSRDATPGPSARAVVPASPVSSPRIV